jgi:cytochrome c biogenesis protein
VKATSFTTATLRRGRGLTRHRGASASARGPGGADEKTQAPDPSDANARKGEEPRRVERVSPDAFRVWLLQTELPKSGKSAARSLSSLPLAISEFLAIAGFSALGTVIEQNKGTAWYVQNYPTETPSFGFIDYPLIFSLGLDRVYTQWYFVSLLVALAASLTACTFTRQLPVWRVSADWKFLDRPSALLNMEEAESLPRAKASDFAERLAKRGYQVFVKGKKMYAFKGLIGRLAPIGVHAGLLLTLGGAAYSGLGGRGGSVMVPEGASFEIAQGLGRGARFAPVPDAARDSVVVNDFTIEYLPNGQVSQFFSDLSVVDGRDGREKQRKTISVNVPLRQGGVTMYQTDWEIASVRVRVEEKAETISAGDSGPAPETTPGIENGASVVSASLESSSREKGDALLLPMANLEGRGDFRGRIWGTLLPLNPGNPDETLAKKGVTFLARDFQSVAIYASDGSFAGVRRPGSGRPIAVDGVRLVVEDMKGSTGLELKTDPGVPWVYAGFAGLMVTSFLSLLSHSQVWAVETKDGALLHVGGRSNRAKEEFKTELDEILEDMPEYL